MKLLIGNKTYSSWSFRPWLLMKHAGIPFEETRISLGQPDFAARVAEWSPAKRVPVLVDGEITVWDSLAIAEYLAEKYPEKHLWPEDRALRAHARSITAEMHSGFASMREALTMICTADVPDVIIPDAARKDIERVIALWTDCHARFGQHGPFLLGRFSIADAFYAPVVTRFTTYRIELPERAREYHATMRALPAFQAWLADAAQETEVLEDHLPRRRSDAPQR